MELLDDDSKVYKQIGPALIRQDHMEATSNVSKRLEFIGAEIKRIDEKLGTIEEKAQKKQGQVEKLQVEVARLKAGASAS